MKWKNTIYLFLVIPMVCSALNFESEWNKKGIEPIRKFMVCGERCSGTNYLKHLIARNFPLLSPPIALEYGHKHFLWWFGQPPN